MAIETPQTENTLTANPETRQAEVEQRLLISGDTLWFKNTPQPIEVRDIVDSQGASKQIPVAMYLKIGENTYWMSSQQDKDSDASTHVTLTQMQQNADGQWTEGKKVRTQGNGPEAFTDESLGLDIDLGYLPKKDQWYLKVQDIPELIQAEVSSASAVKVQEAPSHKEYRRKIRLRIAAAALAAISLVAPVGNAVDKIADRYQDAAKTTIQMFDPAQRELSEVQVIAEVMGDLDAHRYDVIRTRAEAFKARHKDQFIEPQTLQNLKDRIKNASDNQQVLAALDEFMQFYGKHASFYQGGTAIEERIAPFDSTTNVDDTRSLAQSVVGAYSLLPKTILENADFTVVEIGNSAGSAQGSTISGELGLATHSRTGRAFNALTAPSDQWLATHELRHTLQGKEGYPEQSHHAKVAPYVISKILRIPTATSSYAAVSGPTEANAEDVASALTTVEGDAGMAHPDQWREFNSSANKAKIRALVQMVNLAVYHGPNGDENDPDLAYYLIAQNDELMHRSNWNPS